MLRHDDRRTGANVRSGVHGRDYDFDARLGLRILKPRIYLGGGYLWRWNNDGYPRESNVGVGLEKLPDLDHLVLVLRERVLLLRRQRQLREHAVSLRQPQWRRMHVQRRIRHPEVRHRRSYSFQGFPLFIEAGFLGDRGCNYNAAPIGFSESGPYVGIGLKF